MRVAPGQENVTFEVTYISSSGAPVTPDEVDASIFDANGVEIVDDGLAVETDPGTFSYTWAQVPEDAELGLWTIQWKAIKDGLALPPGEEIFEVTTSDVIVIPAEEVMFSRLRSRLGEIPYDALDEAQILDLVSYASGSLDLATLEGWKRKMARWARLVDVSESGSQRQMADKFDHAVKMVALWSKVVGDVDAATSAALGRVVGKAVNLGYKPDPSLAISPFNDYSDYVRMYPTHRLIIPAIL